MLGRIGKYAKFIVAVVGAVSTTTTAWYPVTYHWTTALNAALTALAVLFVPNQGATS